MIAVDTGGTFTDLVIFTQTGSMEVLKIPSNRDDPSLSIIEGIRLASESGAISPGFILSHGTTVATNALLERRGARCALITNLGFRDVIEIGRQARTQLYTFDPSRPEPLVARSDRYELNGRYDYRGLEIVPLVHKEVSDLLSVLRAERYESLAVCLLFAYLNATHEVAFRDAAIKAGFHVSISSDVAPEPREYERTTTTVANAFVGPVLSRYLHELVKNASQLGAAKIRVMQSNGGTIPAEVAAEQAIRTALSGPAGGVVAASRVGPAAGIANMITFDMGGTSTDVSLLTGGKYATVTDGVVGQIPLRIPMIDIHTVGAGGGSIAWVDRAGALRVGPQSAGADPGPVAYGKGVELTVTDANIFLGRLPDETLLAGRVPLDRKRVATYLEQLAKRLNSTPVRVALGIIDLANSAMNRAVQHISTERGLAPSDYTLVAFGGAGGLHACAIADSLSIFKILIPRYPGAFSAFGLAVADVSFEFASSLPSRSLVDDPTSWEQVQRAIDAMMAQASTQFSSADLSGYTSPEHIRLLDLRYEGQAFDLRVDYSQTMSPGEVAASFHQAHYVRYGHCDRSRSIEVVAARLQVIYPAPQREVSVSTGISISTTISMPATSCSVVPLRPAEVYTVSGYETIPLYLREDLAQHSVISGPAVITQTDATTFVATGWVCDTDVSGNAILTREYV